MIRVVAGAVVRDGRVLAALRGPGRSQAGLWELPGGKVEPGEQDADALARELAEELGVTVTVGECFGEATHAYAHATVHLVAYACALSSGEPRAREHAALRWVGRDELSGLVWAPADVPLLAPLAALL